ncbi:MAG TPA: chemotaxis protein CheA [Terracidiphilus sp.]|jgi:two-component system chemotaxis sensor kinase CheA
MSNGEPIEEGQDNAQATLSTLIEKAAVQVVLGNVDSNERIALLKAIYEEAELAGRPELASCVKDALEAVSNAIGQPAMDALLSECIGRIQQLLTRTVAAPGSCLTSNNAKAPALLPLGEDRELIGEFILESRDHLTQVEMQMMTLEKDPEDAEAINTVFRGFHTIKGLAGFLGLDDIRAIAHDTETLLDLVRNHKLLISPAIVDLVLASEDYLKASLLRLEQTLAGTEVGPVPEKDLLLDRIQRTCSGFEESSSPVFEPSQNTGISEPAEPLVRLSTEWTGPERRAGQDCRTQSTEWIGTDRRTGDDRRVQPSDLHFVKVDTAKLDYLVDMAGEMVIAESMVRHHPELAALHSQEVLRRLAQLERITSDLQKTAMSMRMVPISGLFQKMNRLVRDLARKTGKRAELETIGADTELDRNVVEELSDPLMHMVRNAVDHGLEAEQERLSAGKDPIGRIHLRAFHQAGHIVIEIADDGRGLNPDKILDKARRMGLVDASSTLADNEVFELIFHPGFSTAEEITDVSGRGVGMDVVRKKIQKLRGHVAIESNPGRGTSFFLRMPLTLAIIDGLIVGVGRERYIVPIFSVREMLRPTAEMIFTVQGRKEMALVRNSLMPVLRLYELFGVQPRSQEPSESLLIVAEAAGRSFCLMVDDLIGKQEVVIKSLGETIKDVPGIAGGAILGDGRVGLILDLEGILRGASK